MKRSLAEMAAAAGGELVGGNRDFGGVSIDSRTCQSGDLFVALRGDRFDGHDYLEIAVERGAVGAVVSRQCALDVPTIVVPDTLKAMQAMSAAWRKKFSIPVIAVAGSNGKTTTKGMIASILEGNGPCHATKGTLNNHIGVPLTLLGINDTHASAVVEIGANHPGEVAQLTRWVDPTIAVVTNAGAEHLEGFGSIEGAARAEGELFEGLRPTAVAIINNDDQFCGLWRQLNGAATAVTFGLNPGSDYTVNGSVTVAAVERQEFALRTPVGDTSITLSLLGLHNVQNALAAAAAAHVAGASLETIAKGLEWFAAVNGRLQVKEAACGARLIDDTYNANPASLEAALAVLAGVPGERWLVLGNMAELGMHCDTFHRDAGLAARGAAVHRLYTLGADAALAAGSFGEGAKSFTSLEALYGELANQLNRDVTVLLKGSRVNQLERLVDALVMGSGPEV